MVLILDVEKVLAELHPKSDEELFMGVEKVTSLQGKKVLVADDSTVARKQIYPNPGTSWSELGRNDYGKTGLATITLFCQCCSRVRTTVVKLCGCNAHGY